jgi:hypothetical protein
MAVCRARFRRCNRQLISAIRTNARVRMLTTIPACEPGVILAEDWDSEEVGWEPEGVGRLECVVIGNEVVCRVALVVEVDEVSEIVVVEVNDEVKDKVLEDVVDDVENDIDVVAVAIDVAMSI